MIEDIIDHTNFIIFKKSLFNIIISFREKIETYSENNKAVITEF